MAVNQKVFVEFVGKDSSLRNAINQSQKSLTLLEQSAKRLQNTMLGIFSYNVVGGLVNGIQSAVGKIAEFDKAMTGVRIITGATASDFKLLETSAIQLGTSTQYTAKNIADLQLELGRLGFSTKEILQSTRAVVDLSTATGEGLARSAEIAGSTLRAFQLDASEMGRVTDIMASSLNMSALSLDTFADGIKYVSPVAKATGVSLEETAAMMSVLADAGIKGSQAGTSLRRIFTMLTKDGKPLNDKLKELAKTGITLADANDEVGLYAQTALLQLTAMLPRVNELTEAYRNNAGSAKDMASAMEDNLGTSIVKVGTAWDAVVLSFKNSKGVIKEVTDWWAKTLRTFANDRERLFEQTVDFLRSQGGANVTDQQIKSINKLASEFDKVVIKTKEGGIFVEKLRKEIDKLEVSSSDVDPTTGLPLSDSGVMWSANQLLKLQQERLKNQQEEKNNEKSITNELKKQNIEREKELDFAYKKSEIARQERLTRFEAIQKRQLSGDTTDYGSLFRNFIPFSEGIKMPDLTVNTKSLDSVNAMSLAVKNLNDKIIELNKNQSIINEENTKQMELRVASWNRVASAASSAISSIISYDRDLVSSLKKTVSSILQQNASAIASWLAVKFAKDSATKTPVAAIAALTVSIGVISGLLGKDWKRGASPTSSTSRSRDDSGGTVRFEIRGENLYGVLSNYDRKMRQTSYGG